LSKSINSGLASLTNAIFQSLDVSNDASDIVLPRCQHVVLCLIDGLGAHLLKDYAEKAPYLSSLINAGGHELIRSGFPSTTAASLASLATAADSGGHGIVGAAFHIDERQFNPLAWQFFNPDSGSVDDRFIGVEKKILTCQSAWLEASNKGLMINSFLPASIAGSSYTRNVFKGANVIAFNSHKELTERFRASLECRGQRLSYIYFGDLDLDGHLHGPGSRKWGNTLLGIDQKIRDLANEIRNDAVLIVTADHGMTMIDHDKIFDYDFMPFLQTEVSNVCGDIRSRHIYLRDPANISVVNRWRDILGEDFQILTRNEALGSGLFGEHVSDAASSRIGDFLVIAGRSAGIVRSIREPFQTSWMGHHGALTDEEQLVPLIITTKG
jgi:predicted AlkP superfamily pyrophosphatase or phosphodiesterase